MRVVSQWNRWRKCHSKNGRGRIGEISAWLTKRKLGGDSRDSEKHTGRNDLFFVEKMMWMDERVRPLPKMKSECCKEAELG